MLDPVQSQINFPELEDKILKFWEDNHIFEESVDNRRGKERFVFYEGPPTANGLPHIGHILPRSLKDLFLRYKTQKGFLVERKAGWDTHGLPVEIEIEKELGLKGKVDILTLKKDEYESIKFFNEKCRESVFRYVDQWVNLTKRTGLWLDFKNAYVTYDNSYIESVWWFISEVNKRGLLYKDYKVIPYCPRCGTSLSSHELAQGYKDDVEDPAIYVKLELVDEPGTYVLAWTTTPWTIPGNVGLAIGKNIKYVKVEQNGEKYILAKNRLEILGEEAKVIEELNVDDLLGGSYKPPYPYLQDKGGKAHFITEADFATDTDGTGIVHTAVMYGVDDFELGTKLGMPKYHTVNTKGQFIDEVKEFAGLFVKKADPLIIEDLDKKGLLYKSETIKHTYPFCWRCSTPILYYALDSWFIKTTAVKEQLIKNNDQINWKPESIKKGRMGNWLESLIDWNISRNRFWGTPLPVWMDSKGHIQVIGSKDDIKKLGGEVPNDLHRPFIDEVKFNCPECSELMERVPDVMDVWMDSGAMPFAQWHYPFENQEIFKAWYPADYIVEAIDQTRGWFFTLMAEAMLLGENSPAPFKNVITTGHILDEFGQKMSKSKRNGLDPWVAINSVGADTLRWFFYSAAYPGANYPISENILKEKQRKFLLILWNSYKFFLDYASVTNWQCELERGELTVIDKWILASLTDLVIKVNKSMDDFDPTTAARSIEDFVINELSTWYIRRNRDRVNLENEEKDRNLVLGILYGNLVTLTKLLAPFMPFVSEDMYRNLTGEVSVHLTDYPLGDKSLLDKQLIADMKVVRQIVEMGHAKRKEASIKLRQPLKAVSYTAETRLSPELEDVVEDELNVKGVEFKEGKELSVEVDINITEELKEEGDAREFIRSVQQLRKESLLTLKDKIEILAPSWPKRYEEMILKGTGAVSIKNSDKLSINKI